DAVGEHRARAALGEAAAEARSFELELVREHVEERRVRARLDRPGFAVHFDLELVRHAHPPVDQMRSVLIRLQLKRVCVNQREQELGLLPPPLWGRGGEGGWCGMATCACQSRDPHPQPLPTRGRGALPARGAIVLQTQTRLSKLRDANKQQYCRVTLARAGGMPAGWRSWFAPAGRSD